MGQTIKVICEGCGTDQEFQTEKCIMVLWTKGKVGVVSHDAGQGELLEAMKRLASSIPRHSDRSDN